MVVFYLFKWANIIKMPPQPEALFADSILLSVAPVRIILVMIISVVIIMMAIFFKYPSDLFIPAKFAVFQLYVVFLLPHKEIISESFNPFIVFTIKRAVCLLFSLS